MEPILSNPSMFIALNWDCTTFSLFGFSFHSHARNNYKADLLFSFSPGPLACENSRPSSLPAEWRFARRHSAGSEEGRLFSQATGPLPVMSFSDKGGLRGKCCNLKLVKNGNFCHNKSKNQASLIFLLLIMTKEIGRGKYGLKQSEIDLCMTLDSKRISCGYHVKAGLCVTRNFFFLPKEMR